MDPDIIALLEDDHHELRRRFAEIPELPAHERGPASRALVSLLASHETAEEAIVHPALRDETPGGAEPAGELLAEEAGAEQLLSELEATDPESPEFVRPFHRLEQAVLTHATHEEREVFPRLRELGSDRRRELGTGFATLREHAPTHPHPHTPATPQIRAALAPLVGMFDRARDVAHELTSR